MPQLDKPVVAVVVAAGSGSRLGAALPKALVELDGVPLVRRAVDALADGGVTDIVVTIPEGMAEAFGRALEGAAVPVGCIVGGDTLPERKPSAMPLLHLVEHFGLSPAQCLMVGDSETDLLTAQAAGMPMALVTYGYLRGFDPHSVEGVRVIDDLRELLR